MVLGGQHVDHLWEPWVMCKPHKTSNDIFLQKYTTVWTPVHYCDCIEGLIISRKMITFLKGSGNIWELCFNIVMILWKPCISSRGDVSMSFFRMPNSTPKCFSHIWVDVLKCNFESFRDWIVLLDNIG